jgi:hypothetical protein
MDPQLHQLARDVRAIRNYSKAGVRLWVIIFLAGSGFGAITALCAGLAWVLRHFDGGAH